MNTIHKYVAQSVECKMKIERKLFKKKKNKTSNHKVSLAFETAKNSN